MAKKNSEDTSSEKLLDITKQYDSFTKKIWELEKKNLIKDGWIFKSVKEEGDTLIVHYQVTPKNLKKSKRKDFLAYTGMAILGVLILIAIFGPDPDSNSNKETVIPDAPAPYSYKEEQLNIQKQFSLADGMHYELMKKTILHMHNPNSFKHMKTNYFINRDADGHAETLNITMVFQGIDDFGDIYVSTANATADLDGKILDFKLH